MTAMQIRELMTETPTTVTRQSSLQEAAKKMKDHDCGALPVIGNEDGRRPIGIITDRDITVRIVAAGKNPLEQRVEDAMTESTVTVKPDSTDKEASRLMEENKIRRLVVVGDDGSCVGMVSQADIARRAPEGETAEVVSEVSQPTGEASRPSS